MRVIGIDPGKTGAFAMLNDRGGLYLHDMPMRGSEIDSCSLYKSLWSLMWDHVFVERVELRHNQSGVINMVANYGRILAVAEMSIGTGHSKQLIEITSKEWQKQYNLPKDRKEKLKAYTAIAADMWPDQTFYGPKGGLKDGRAAAALIALHGMQTIKDKP